MSRPSPSIDEVFFAALERESPEARAAYLDEVCASDPDLRRRVERLLDAQPKVGSFLDAPAAGPTLTLAPPQPMEGPGTVIGPYKLLEQIGEGGMGVVYMAEQTQPQGIAAGPDDNVWFGWPGPSEVGKINPTTDVFTYFVNAQAGGATYAGSVVNWEAIGSTSSVSAINNVGQTTTPVYLADGTLVTTSTTSTGLWSGSILNPIDEDLSSPGRNSVDRSKRRRVVPQTQGSAALTARGADRLSVFCPRAGLEARPSHFGRRAIPSRCWSTGSMSRGAMQRGSRQCGRGVGWWSSRRCDSRNRRGRRS